MYVYLNKILVILINDLAELFKEAESQNLCSSRRLHLYVVYASNKGSEYA